MNVDDYRLKARHFTTLARQITRLTDKAAMIVMAAFWMRRADEEAERDKRQPEKEPEAEPC